MISAEAGTAVVDRGYFPRGESVLRRVQGERAVGLLYGQRALMIGAAHPLNYVGTVLSTRSPGQPFRRLVHTAKVFETIFFGTRAEADKVLAFVDRLHQGVRGTLPENAGPWERGTPYTAMDPELMLWTLAVQVDSAYVLYETLVRRLSDDERETLWQEYVRFGELFGLSREDSPHSYTDFRAYWDRMLTSGELHLTPGAREAGLQTAFHIPVPPNRRPGMAAANFLVLGSLPPAIRKLYGLSWSARQERKFRAAAAALRGSRPMLPHIVRRGVNVAFYDLVARTERARIRRGEPTWRASI